MITTTARVTAPDAGPRGIIGTLLWGLQILLAAFFLFNAALPKLIGSDSSVQEFGLIGAGQWLRYLIGTAELGGDRPAYALARRAGGRQARRRHGRRDHHQCHGAARHHIRRQRLDDRAAVRRVHAPRPPPVAADQGSGGSHSPPTRAAASTMRTEDRTILRYLDGQ